MDWDRAGKSLAEEYTQEIRSRGQPQERQVERFDCPAIKARGVHPVNSRWALFVSCAQASLRLRTLVNSASGLGGTQNARACGYGVRGPVSAGPFGKTESAGDVDAVDGDVVISERRFGLAEFGSAGACMKYTVLMPTTVA